jgi:aryl-alcohol dehydrogenase-like predicted oxidoreductase
MGIDPGDLSWVEWALRFSVFVPGVSAGLVGTRSIVHLEEAVQAVTKGPLPASVQDAIQLSFARSDDGWTGRI